MKIESSGQAQAQLMQQLRSDRIDQKREGKDVEGSSKAIDNFNANRGQGKAKGIIKKFQDPESHFNGMADLRLRINFADQLQELTPPPVSEPKGKGSAYGRFLEIYESLGTDTKDTDETLNVDESGDIQTEA